MSCDVCAYNLSLLTFELNIEYTFRERETVYNNLKQIKPLHFR